ncbi:MAG: hypothetical protein M1480_05555 [Bacteroidetes bacterium]|nr:hypothetical protein [Bacteroidota bacterium]
MFKIKSFLLPVLFFFLCRLNFAASFTYSGPTSATIQFGQSSASATYYFSYSGLGELFQPALSITVDGTTIFGPHACQSDASTPSSYTITFNAAGTHTVYFMLSQLVDDGSQCGHRELVKDYSAFNVSVYFQISVENIFSGGTINVDGSNRTSPYYRSSSGGNNVSLGAVEQDNGGYHWIWNTSGTYNSEWDKEPSGGGSGPFNYSQNTSYSVQSNDINTSIVAALRKVCNITFQNNFVGVGNDGNITINGTQYGSPASGFTVTEQNPISGSASYRNLNGINYYFDHWSEEGGTNSSYTFHPTSHKTYTAYFKGYPSNVGKNLYNDLNYDSQ